MITAAQEQSVQQSTTIQRLQQEQSQLRSQIQGTHLQSTQVSTQLQTMIRSISPVLQGNLRMRVDLPPGEVGILGDICNALIEEVVKLVHWTRASSQHLTKSTQTVLRSAAELAQNVETQLHQSAQTTEAAEQVVTFLQRLNGALHLSLEHLQEIQRHLQYSQSAPLSLNILQQVQHTMGQQAQLFTELEQETYNHLLLAEAIMIECYDGATRLYQSSTNVLQTAEQLTELTTMARQWEQEVAPFQLPEPLIQKPTTSAIETPAWEPQGMASLAARLRSLPKEEEGSIRAHLL